MQPRSRSKYKDAIKLLDDQFAYFVTHVLNIGRPIDTDIVPTACVMVVGEKAKSGKVGDDFSFAFNPDFADQLELEDYAFILAHETMHILLDHLTLSRIFPDKNRFNLAADAVINDYLIEAGFDVTSEIENSLISGHKIVGYNCAHATVSQVYDDIPQDVVDKYEEFFKTDDHEWMLMPEGEMKDLIDKIIKGSAIPQEINDLRDDINKKSGVGVLGGGKLAGDGTTDVRSFMEVNGVSMNWINLLKELNPHMFTMKGGKRPRPSYAKRPRKLGGFPDIILPIKEKSNQNKFGEKPVIFMALDTSGSIGDQTARKFITLARSIPKKDIHLEVVTFTTSIMECDLDNPQFRSGGTEFSIIENHIRNKVMPKYKNKYPGSVVVITDGCARFSSTQVDEKHKDRWFWLIDGSYTDSYYTRALFGTIKTLGDYIK